LLDPDGGVGGEFDPDGADCGGFGGGVAGGGGEGRVFCEHLRGGAGGEVHFFAAGEAGGQYLGFGGSREWWGVGERERGLLGVTGGVGVLRAEVVERDADFFFREFVALVGSVVSSVSECLESDCVSETGRPYPILAHFVDRSPCAP